MGDPNLSTLYESLAINNFVGKTLRMWDELYREFQISMCAKHLPVDLAEMKRNSKKYFGCMTLIDGQHVCGIVPIIIGTRLDKEIRNVTDDGGDCDDHYIRNFSSAILNSGFFAYIPNYFTNNVRKLHQFKSRQYTTNRLFLYDTNSYGHMLYVKNGKLIMRMPNKTETELNAENYRETLAPLYGYSLGVPITADDMFSLTDLYDMFDIGCDAAEPPQNHIDSLSNKQIINGPTLLQLALQQVKNVPGRKDIMRKRILTGNLSFLISKKIVDFDSDIKKQNKYLARGSDAGADKELQSIKSMYYTLNETLLEQNNNTLKRIMTKNSRFIGGKLPDDGNGFISIFFVGSVANARRTMVMTHHTRITYVTRKRVSQLYGTVANLLRQLNEERDHDNDYDDDDHYRLAFNNFVCANGRSYRYRDLYLLYLYLKTREQQIYMSVDRTHRILYIYLQTGIIQRPVCINIDFVVGKCPCGQFTRNFYQLVETDAQLMLKEWLESLPGSKCVNHVWLSSEEITLLGSFARMPYYELMCSDAIYNLRHFELTPISKAISSNRTYRMSFKRVDSFGEVSEALANKELSRGFIAQPDTNLVSLFTFFHDYQGGNVADGYQLGDHVKLPIKIYTKHSIVLEKRSKKPISLEKILSLTYYKYHTELVICKIYSKEPIRAITEKKIKMQIIKNTKREFIYVLKQTMIHGQARLIDPSALHIAVSQYKKTITISVHNSSKPNIRYPIKISNAYGQKGMCRVVDLSRLVRANGRPVDLTANPVSIVSRAAVGQIHEMQETLEPVYDSLTGRYLGNGGYCFYFISSIFLHDEVHGSVFSNAMRLDKLLYNAMIGNNLSVAAAILMKNHHRQNTRKLFWHINFIKLMHYQLECR